MTLVISMRLKVCSCETQNVLKRESLQVRGIAASALAATAQVGFVRIADFLPYDPLGCAIPGLVLYGLCCRISRR